jgi:D-apiose dehydrogenase
MPDLRGGLIGCGWFARNHLYAWREVRGAEIVAVCDVDPGRARAAAAEHDVPAAYTDPEVMLAEAELDFVDIVTPPATHRELVELAARHGRHVICQKPLAPTLEDARAMVEPCSRAGIRFMCHENFRWQRPMRRLKAAAADLGELFFGRIVWRTDHDVYANQPYLAKEPRFIIADLGVHLLDLARFFLGDPEDLCAHTRRINAHIRGEDTATIMLGTSAGATCMVELSYASRLEEDLFPQTLVHLEGTRGSATLGADFQLTVVDDAGVRREDVAPRRYPWSVAGHEAIQESVIAIQQHWTDCLREYREPETSGSDNLRTLELVYGAYQSAETRRPYRTSYAHFGNAPEGGA